MSEQPKSVRRQKCPSFNLSLSLLFHNNHQQFLKYIRPLHKIPGRTQKGKKKLGPLIIRLFARVRDIARPLAVLDRKRTCHFLQNAHGQTHVHQNTLQEGFGRTAGKNSRITGARLSPFPPPLLPAAYKLQFPRVNYTTVAGPQFRGLNR